MSIPAPHFLLFSEANSTNHDSNQARGQWRFVLEEIDGTSSLDVSDSEPDAQGERLELLAVLRGLEALDKPSRVTLVTASRYVSRGIRQGLDQWRDNDWRWERYGKMVPIANSDLWRRIDQTLHYHQLSCRTLRFDRPVETDQESQTPAVEHRNSLPQSTTNVETERMRKKRLSRFVQVVYRRLSRSWGYLAAALKRRTETCPVR